MIRRLAAVLVTGGALTIAAPSAHADTLNCLAPVTAVQNLNNQAVRYDQAGNTASAAGADAGATYYENQARPACYYNPAVPYSAYQDAISAFTYVDAAHAANNAGNAAAALSDGQTAASYLSAAVALLNRAP